MLGRFDNHSPTWTAAVDILDSFVKCWARRMRDFWTVYFVAVEGPEISLRWLEILFIKRVGDSHARVNVEYVHTHTDISISYFAY